MNLSFGDGFKFGCGFFAASIFAMIVLGLVGAIVSVAATLLGAGAMIPLGQLLQ